MYSAPSKSLSLLRRRRVSLHLLASSVAPATAPDETGALLRVVRNDPVPVCRDAGLVPIVFSAQTQDIVVCLSAYTSWRNQGRSVNENISHFFQISG